MRVLLFAVLLLSTGLANATTYIDVLVLYNSAVNDRYASAPVTRFNQLIQVSNQVFTDSQLNIQLRLAHSELINYPTTIFDTALTDLKKGAHPAFSSVRSLRQAYGADVVILFQPVAAGDDTCGIAYLNGAETSGDLSTSRDYAYAVVSPNANDGCGDDTLVHEIGHLMGLAHSRLQTSYGDGEGTLPYATGHGEYGSFVTIMPYESMFGVYSNRVAYKFSSPSLTCFYMPCGVNRSDAARGADSVYALTITAPQVAAYYPEPVKAAPSSQSMQLKQLKSSKKAIEKQLKTARKNVKGKNKTQIKFSAASNKASALYANLQAITQQYGALQETNADARTLARTFKVYAKTKAKYDKALIAANKLAVKLNSYGDPQATVNYLLASLADINNRIAMLKKSVATTVSAGSSLS